LRDDTVVKRIVDAVNPRPDELIVEIGPGTGVLTEVFLDRCGSLHVVEIDRDLVAQLRERFAGRNLTIHQGDALEFDFSALGKSPRLVGNLPYNISTPLLFHLGAQLPNWVDGHFMLQKEVVDRMIAAPSCGDYGRLTVMIQYRFRVERLFDVPSAAFRPPPKVDSAVVRMTPRAEPLAKVRDERLFRELVTRAFTQRRKMIRNALKEFVDEQDWSTVGLNPALRPENLTVENYADLANYAAER
jgi:16S rRNA (adenine1518-N6/adenine1519-N6)-dimethyltransferase